MTTPAGWYEDPGAPRESGQLRWWDGSSWTEHTRAQQYAAQQYAAQQYASQQYPPQQHLAQQYPPQQYPGQYPGYGAQAPQTPDGVPLASIWARLGAKILDGVLLGVLTLLATLPTWPGLRDAIARYENEIDRAVVNGATPDPFSLLGDPGYQAYVLWGIVSSFLITALYTVLLLRFKGATLGKLALGMRVRRWETAGQLSWGACLVRWAVQTLPVQVTCGLWFLIDSLWCTWDAKRQTLHDKAARTVVVAKR
jgi:uncharacterized RDD family membrane protein YckC